ncbi:uncharacterized protein BJ171DRAFT_586697 [Polychytrium aggregatum]|uniref:uncharacterized protein n=1 Tax=Polychytrium aggregatum TaxID=110093 RepID=UPI0022FEEE4C|nr:uncharacterized protein BJ171DRAFT_586697 [Polychytrium aggregatum]KAI9193721.1 hypothetical protein BJ171DRAFT_586697 [Polychytrium aggregatum]
MSLNPNVASVSRSPSALGIGEPSSILPSSESIQATLSTLEHKRSKLVSPKKRTNLASFQRTLNQAGDLAHSVDLHIIDATGDGGDLRSDILGERGARVFRLPKPENIAEAEKYLPHDDSAKITRDQALQFIGVLQAPPGSGAKYEKPKPPSADRPLKPEARLDIESQPDDFRKFQQSVLHPGRVLGVMAFEDDRAVLSTFDQLCNEVLSCIAEFESSLEEMTTWKNAFMKQSIPSNVKLQLAILFGRLFRCKSDLHEPLFELIKQVRIYSRPWLKKQKALLELEKDFQSQNHVLDVAIRKLEHLHAQKLKIITEKSISLWDRLVRSLMDATPAYNPFYEAQASVNSSGLADSKLGAQSSDNRMALSMKRSGALKSIASNSALSPLPGVNKLKTSILEYITTDDPSWKKQARNLVEKFRKHINKQCRGWQALFRKLHQRPFPRPSMFPYMSLLNQSFIKPPRPFPLRKSWSLVDLSSASTLPVQPKSWLTGDENEYRHDRDLYDGKIPRSNSFNAAFDLRSARIRNMPSRKRTKGARRRHRKAMYRMKTQFRISDGQSSDSDSESSSSDDDDDSFVDDELADYEQRYWDFFDEDQIQHTIDSFLTAHPFTSHSQKSTPWRSEVKTPANRTESQEKSTVTVSFPSDEPEVPDIMAEEPAPDFATTTEPTEPLHGDETPADAADQPDVDVDKGWFSLQDVMELTLLHAQQMQLLQSEYSDKFDDMTEKMEAMEAKHKEDVEDLEKRLVIAQEAAQRIARDWQNMAEQKASAESRAMTVLTGPGGSTHGPGTADSVRFELSDTAGGASSTKSKSRSGKSRRSSKSKKKQHRGPFFLKQRESNNQRGPIFTTAPFEMSFLERLRWFTEEKLRRQNSLREKFVRMEVMANEQRLAQAHLLNRDPDPRITSPWGGRFHISSGQNESEDTQASEVNILNLFDVAIKTRIKPKQQKDASLRLVITFVGS